MYIAVMTTMPSFWMSSDSIVQEIYLTAVRLDSYPLLTLLFASLLMRYLNKSLQNSWLLRPPLS